MILADYSEPESNSIETAIPNSDLLPAITKAYTSQEQLESGQFESLEDIAKEHRVDRNYVGRILQLTYLSPDIVESILAGQTSPTSACGIAGRKFRSLGRSNGECWSKRNEGAFECHPLLRSVSRTAKPTAPGSGVTEIRATSVDLAQYAP